MYLHLKDFHVQEHPIAICHAKSVGGQHKFTHQSTTNGKYHNCPEKEQKILNQSKM